MRVGARLLAFLLVTVAAFWFTAANAAERVTVDLVLFRVSASLPLVVFGSVLVGMLAMIAVGLRADLRTRRVLERQRGGMAGQEPRGEGPPAR